VKPGDEARGAPDEWRREPDLDELLADPMAQLLMRRDGTDEAELRDLLEKVGRRLNGEAE
jgi:hypothetical protein